MHLAALSLVDFRNYPAFSAELTPEVHLLVGDNGAGKTSLLEAIHYLSTLKSFRAGNTRELVRLGTEATRVSGVVEGGEGTDRLEVILRPPERQATVDGKSPASVADYLLRFPTVKFVPEDVLLWKGEAAARRRALDRAVFGLEPVHFERLTACGRALRQRNAWLRMGGADPREGEAWTAALATHGAEVVAARLAYLERLRPFLNVAFEGIGGEALPALSYRGPVARPTAVAEIEGALREELTRRFEEERRRGFSLAGPHRDDLEARIGDRSLKRYASQGQHRLFALALKIAEIELFRKERGHFPVLLLDDVRSELDPSRVRSLFRYLNNIPAQTFVTTTHLESLEGEVERPATVWKVEAGSVSSR